MKTMFQSDGSLDSNCEPFEISISAMLDGELSPREKDALGEHLIQCSRCRQMVRDFEVVDQTVWSLADRRIERDAGFSGRHRTSRFWQVVPAALAMATAVCLLVLIWPGDGQSGAGQVTAEQIIQPMRELRQVSLEQEREQDVSLKTMEISLRMLRLELSEIQDEQQREAMLVRIEQLLSRVHAEQEQ